MLHASVAALARALEQRYAIHLPLDEIRFLQAMFSLGQYNYYDEAKVSAMLSRESESHANRGGTISNHQSFPHAGACRVPAIDMNDRFIWEIGDFFEKLRLENALPDLIAISASSLTEYVQRDCRPMYQSVKSCMQEWSQRYPAFSITTII